MGSWNATCGVTQLPIRAGTPVVLIPLVVKQHDFLARDTLAGCGSTANDLIAQPLALPIYGTYNDYGGVDTPGSDEGQQFFVSLLRLLASRGELMHNRNGDPRPLANVNDRTLDKFNAGELLLQVDNTRKQWLLDLKKTIDGAKDKSGFSHYADQLKVDPQTLPDHFLFALGFMLVPRALYDSLCESEGAEKAFGYFDEGKRKMVTYDGNRAAELSTMCSLSPKQKTVVTALAKMRDVFGADDDKDGLSAKGMSAAATQMLLQQANRLNRECFFYSEAAGMAVNAAASQDNRQALSLWVNFMLFVQAMRAMRKQWTPQAGAGDSNGLEYSARLYEATHAFVAKELAANKTEEEAEAGH